MYILLILPMIIVPALTFDFIEHQRSYHITFFQQELKHIHRGRLVDSLIKGDVNIVFPLVIFYWLFMIMHFGKVG